MTKDQHPDAIEEECDVLEAIGSRLEDEEELAKESRWFLAYDALCDAYVTGIVYDA